MWSSSGLVCWKKNVLLYRKKNTINAQNNVKITKYLNKAVYGPNKDVIK